MKIYLNEVNAFCIRVKRYLSQAKICLISTYSLCINRWSNLLDEGLRDALEDILLLGDVVEDAVKVELPVGALLRHHDLPVGVARRHRHDVARLGRALLGARGPHADVHLGEEGKISIQ